MRTMQTWRELKKEMLKDPAFRRAYDDLEPEFRMACSLIEARLEKKMTQQELAKRAGITQNMVAKLESGTTNPTINTVSKVASILGKELRLVGTNS